MKDQNDAFSLQLHRAHTLLLTGTPIQNNLNELFALLALVALKEFRHPAVEGDNGIDGNAFATTYRDADKVQSGMLKDLKAVTLSCKRQYAMIYAVCCRQ